MRIIGRIERVTLKKRIIGIKEGKEKPEKTKEIKVTTKKKEKLKKTSEKLKYPKKT